MKRRDIIKYTAFATGAAVSAPLINSLLTGCNSEVANSTSAGDLKFFTNEQFELVSDLVDIILPKTDSPSATDVGVHNMIDHMVAVTYNEESKVIYSAELKSLVSYLSAGGYSKMSGEDKLSLLQDVLQSTDEANANTKNAMVNLKQQTVAYYLSSEEIGTKYLNYLPVPGAYEPCITLEEAGGKAYAI